MAQAQVEGRAHVVENAKAAEEPDVLERPRDAPRRDDVGFQPRDGSTAERDGAFGGCIDPRDDVKHRRLARAVRADEADQLALAHAQVHAGNGREAAEAHRAALEIEQRDGDGHGKDLEERKNMKDEG